MCLYIHIFFIHSSVDEHLGLFHRLVIVNCAAVNMGVQLFLLYDDLHMPRNNVAESFDSSIFSFLRNLHTDFHSDFTSSHSYQYCMKVLSLAASPTFVVVCLFGDSHSDGG
jgi:hypothetical protein